ncbi:MAG: LLM class flavin-dependent oxidoreductase [Pseudochelatococcus sp.]|jgi:alkanesulfonate monooxygenase SsuD/methylene tetrahydromethanopterin reductase-like flavin-dependent oxidoreductase (luciferase family)|uniref:LLM class flavin-dependent oxidoreductase n=1 Tax=Pseudochelatococcus sp. TaxID=2020869 RepID=UPI003D8E18CA
MRFGLFCLMSVHDNPGGLGGVIRDAERLVQMADDIGFETAWFAEHHFSNYSLSVSPVMMGARFSGLTKQIRMGTGVIVLPLYHPLRVAQEIALLDQMTEGRIAIGIGSGYQPYEFTRYGQDVARKTDIFLEYWDIVEQALTLGEVEYGGEFISLPKTVITARLSGGMPDIFLTAADPRVLKRFDKHRPISFATAGAAGTPKLYGLYDNLRNAWEVADMRSPMAFAPQQYVHVTDSREQALKVAAHAREVARGVALLRDPQPELDGSHLVSKPVQGEVPLEETVRNIICGDAHYVAERIVEEIRRLDPVHYSTFFNFGDMPVAWASKSLERFGKEVIPLVEREVGPLDRFGAQSELVAAD